MKCEPPPFLWGAFFVGADEGKDEEIIIKGFMTEERIHQHMQQTKINILTSISFGCIIQTYYSLIFLEK